MQTFFISKELQHYKPAPGGISGRITSGVGQRTQRTPCIKPAGIPLGREMQSISINQDGLFQVRIVVLCISQLKRAMAFLSAPQQMYYIFM